MDQTECKQEIEKRIRQKSKTKSGDHERGGGGIKKTQGFENDDTEGRTKGGKGQNYDVTQAK